MNPPRCEPAVVAKTPTIVTAGRSTGVSQACSEHSADNSSNGSNSGVSYNDRSMNCEMNRSGQSGRGNRGARGAIRGRGQGRRTLSGSSSTSKGHAEHETPVLWSASASQGRHAQEFTTHGGRQHWAYQQELKIKLLGMPRANWTKDVYQSLKSYGNIVRIEIQKSLTENQAWVTFQPPPKIPLPTQLRFGSLLIRWESYSTSGRVTPSPTDTSKLHHEQNILFANSITFGTKNAELSMIDMQTVENSGAIQVALNLHRKVLDIQFQLCVGSLKRNFRFRLPIALLSRIYKATNEHEMQTSLIIPFDFPPQFFLQRSEDETLLSGDLYTSFSMNERIWNDWSTWFRVTNVVDDPGNLQKLPLMTQQDNPIIDIGRWTCYKLSFSTESTNKAQFQDFVSALVDYGVDIQIENGYAIKEKSGNQLYKMLQNPHIDTVSATLGFEDLFANEINLPFSVRYQLEACLSNGFLKEHSITAEFLERIVNLKPRNAIEILEKVVDKQQVFYDPMDIFRLQIRRGVQNKIPRYCILQRSAVITPTMIYVASPQVEISNRITRKHVADADHFIRIKFTDEKTEGVLRNMPNNRAEALFNRVRRAMKYGIIVAGRFYEFLAFGNSQLREHGAYFYAPTSTKSAEDIRQSLGQFDHIKTVAKFGARLGQCFSTTRAMGVTAKVVPLPDIERDDHCFTDGVGKISPFLAQMAAEELGLPNPFNDPPSLYQFRLGGCKGVLALDPSLTGIEVHIRPSQQKFEAESAGLEIIRSSAFATPFFNRQIIVVLSTLGVPDSVFVKKQEAMINDYELAMTDEATAISNLRKHVDVNQTTLMMAGMVHDGFMKHCEPFIMSLLKLWRAATIKNLKEKARIVIENGAFVLGCVDETATLRGHKSDSHAIFNATRSDKLANLPEVFIQVDDPQKKGHYKIIESICILARNPSLHPGDLRIVRAVNVPDLHHLRNVVVLPQTGDRDLASMCSGGDLDGDDYMVLWDHDLLPQLINEPPMDFAPEKPLEQLDVITADDIGEFLVTYMENDSLGQIAHAHLAQADSNADGVQSEACLELAFLHSRAVDYPKSGVPATMKRELRPNKWPHFMEKKHIHPSKIYRSKNILGILYDQMQLIEFVPQWKNTFDHRILDAYELPENVLEKAAEIKLSYDEAIKRLMTKHGIRTEFEAWSVFVMQHNHESRDYKFAEEFGRTIAAVKTRYKQSCLKAAEATGISDWARIGPFVAAMYKVTARECEIASPVGSGNSGQVPMISFPWIFATELGRIATDSI